MVKKILQSDLPADQIVSRQRYFIQITVHSICIFFCFVSSIFQRMHRFPRELIEMFELIFVKVFLIGHVFHLH